MLVDYGNDHGNVDNLHHQPNPNNPTRRPKPHHARPYELPWYQDTFWGMLINRISKGKALPFPEERDDFVPPEEYLPGYKTKHAKNNNNNNNNNIIASIEHIVGMPEHSHNQTCSWRSADWSRRAALGKNCMLPTVDDSKVHRSIVGMCGCGSVAARTGAMAQWDQ